MRIGGMREAEARIAAKATEQTLRVSRPPSDLSFRRPRLLACHSGSINRISSKGAELNAGKACATARNNAKLASVGS
jgi:hypothetical protein